VKWETSRGWGCFRSLWAIARTAVTRVEPLPLGAMVPINSPASSIEQPIQESIPHPRALCCKQQEATRGPSTANREDTTGFRPHYDRPQVWCAAAATVRPMAPCDYSARPGISVHDYRR